LVIGIGVLLLLGGGPLAIAPLGAMRAASRLRFTGMPSDPTEAQIRTWRTAGVAMVILGVALIAASALS
jgi:hypothetical protein